MDEEDRVLIKYTELTAVQLLRGDDPISVTDNFVEQGMDPSMAEMFVETTELMLNGALAIRDGTRTKSEVISEAASLGCDAAYTELLLDVVESRIELREALRMRAETALVSIGWNGGIAAARSFARGSTPATDPAEEALKAAADWAEKLRDGKDVETGSDQLAQDTYAVAMWLADCW